MRAGAEQSPQLLGDEQSTWSTYFQKTLSRTTSAFLIFITASVNTLASGYGQKASSFDAQDLDELNESRSLYFRKKSETGQDELVRIFTRRMKPLGFETEVRNIRY